MCDPVTAFTALGVAGGISSGIAAYRSGRAGARLADAQAAAERETARLAADRHRRHVRRVLGEQRAQYANAGVLLEGTPASVLADTAAEGALDALTIERGGRLRAEAARGQAEGMRRAAASGLATGLLGAGRTVLGGMALDEEATGGRSAISRMLA